MVLVGCRLVGFLANRGSARACMFESVIERVALSVSLASMRSRLARRPRAVPSAPESTRNRGIGVAVTEGCSSTPRWHLLPGCNDRMQLASEPSSRMLPVGMGALESARR